MEFITLDRNFKQFGSVEVEKVSFEGGGGEDSFCATLLTFVSRRLFNQI